MKNQVKLSMQSHGDNVGVARMAAATFSAQAALTLGEIDEIKVAISEAVSNAIIHGYANQQGMVELSMSLYEDRIEYIVVDAGQGIADVAAARKPSHGADSERMGLGFAFMESFMDTLAVTSAVGKGTTVKMVKKFSVGAAKRVD